MVQGAVMIKRVMLGALASSLMFLSCNGGAKDGGGTLHLFNWTYYTPDEVLRDFEAATGVHVEVDSFDSNEVMYAKLKAGATGYDITVPSQDYTSIMIKQGMLKEIDHSLFPNKDKINGDLLKKATYDSTMKWSVPYYMGAAGVAVNKTKLSGYARNWSIFADERIKGHASMMDDMREVLGDALAFQGRSVNTTDDKDLQEAAKLVGAVWKPNLVKFDAEGFGKSFAAGDFWVCQGYAEVVYGEVPEAEQGMIDFFIPSEGGPMYIDSMVILKGAKNYEAAMKFINFIHEGKEYAKFLDAFRFPNYVNTEADEYRTTVPMYEAEEMANCELKMDVGEALEKYNRLWEEIRFGD